MNNPAEEIRELMEAVELTEDGVRNEIVDIHQKLMAGEIDEAQALNEAFKHGMMLGGRGTSESVNEEEMGDEERRTMAMDQLTGMGVTIYDRQDGGQEFVISAEDAGPDDTVWADYYDGQNIPGWDFGVNPEVTKVLDHYKLRSEWKNPGELGVYNDF